MFFLKKPTKYCLTGKIPSKCRFYICSIDNVKDVFLIKDNLFSSKQHKSAFHYQLVDELMYYYADACLSKRRTSGITLQLAKIRT